MKLLENFFELGFGKMFRDAKIANAIEGCCAERAALEMLWEKLTPGAYIVLDDYGYPSCGIQKFGHDNFAARKNVPFFHFPPVRASLRSRLPTLQ